MSDTRILCDWLNCQGCPNCPDIPFGRPADEVVAEMEARDPDAASLMPPTDRTHKPGNDNCFCRGCVKVRSDRFFREQFGVTLNVETREKNLQHERLDQRAIAQLDYAAAHAPGQVAPVDGLTIADFTQEVTLLDAERLPPALTRSDGATLLYEERFNTLTAETAQGKSWLALMVAIERIRAGRHVFWLDFEDRATTLATRLQKLNATDLIGTPELKWATGDLTAYPVALAGALEHLAGGNGPGLIVIDSAGSGGCPSDGADVGPWMLANIKPWLDAGHTILLLDHVPKQRKDRPRGGIGSNAKLRDIDGAALYVEGKVWNGTQDGYINLFNHKDRGGNLPGQLLDCVATVFGEHDGPVIRYTIDLPNAKGQEEDLQDELLDAITRAGATGITGSRAMRDSLKGKRAKDVDAAREELLQQGLIERRKVGRAFNYFSTEN